ncbi:hypothetical protein BD309DRAFT_974617 [Dichomitus squalens]|nr:hypothetical protein BD309DRAFT_974617 [Dichomitus squalens]
MSLCADQIIFAWGPIDHDFQAAFYAVRDTSSIAPNTSDTNCARATKDRLLASSPDKFLGSAVSGLSRVCSTSSSLAIP